VIQRTVFFTLHFSCVLRSKGCNGLVTGCIFRGFKIQNLQVALKNASKSSVVHDFCMAGYSCRRFAVTRASHAGRVFPAPLKTSSHSYFSCAHWNGAQVSHERLLRHRRRFPGGATSLKCCRYHPRSFRDTALHRDVPYLPSRSLDGDQSKGQVPTAAFCGPLMCMDTCVVSARLT